MVRKGDVKIVPRKKGAGNGIKPTNPAGPRHGRLVTGDEVDLVFGSHPKSACKAHKIGWGEGSHGEAFFLIAVLPSGKCSLVTKDPNPANPPAPTIPVDDLWKDPPRQLIWTEMTQASFFLELPNWPVRLKSCHAPQSAGGNPKAQYVSAEDGGGREVRADREIPGLWETFSLIRLTQRDKDSLQSGDLVCLQAANGQYLTAEGGGGREVLANRQRPSDWETFIVGEAGLAGIADGDKITLCTQDGKYYMTAEQGPGGGGGAVNMNRTEAADWETFTIEFPDLAQRPIP